jgi:hypothetical protein
MRWQARSSAAVWVAQEGSPLKWTTGDWAGPLALGFIWFLGAMAFYRKPAPGSPPPKPSRLRTIWPRRREPEA